MSEIFFIADTACQIKIVQIFHFAGFRGPYFRAGGRNVSAVLE